MIHPNFVYLGIVLQAIGSIDYLIGTIKGKVKPNRVTWFLWALVPFIVLYAQLKQGVGSEAFTTFVVGFFPLLTFLASFLNKKAVWNISKLDIICGVISLGGLFLWFITRSGNVAILFSIIADGLACVPTIVKSWKEPETEAALAYFLGALNAIIGLLVIKTWNFENYAFLVYIFIACSVLTVLIHFKVGKLYNKV